jgi:fungalysin metallopeptidase (M36)/pre-peptidase/fungalysin/thermolysin propeptide
LRKAFAGILIAFVCFIAPASGQISEARKKPLSNFDAREVRIGGKTLIEQIQADPTVARRRSDLTSFLNSAEERQFRTRIVPNLRGLPKTYLRDGQPLTAPSALNPAEIGKTFLKSQPMFFLNASDIDGLRVASEDSSGNATFLAFNQTINGIDVFNAQIKFTLSKTGEVIMVSTGDVVPGLDISITPGLSAAEAVEAAFRSINSPVSGITKAPELVVFPMTASSATLAYRIFIEVDSESWYEILVDANSGGLLFRHNLYKFAQAGVWTESPAVGNRRLIAFPDPSQVNPAGWIPAGGTVTTGNNVDAYLDATGDGLPDNTTIPNMQNGRAFSASQVFDFPFGDGTSQQDPRLFQPAAVTNLFYHVNVAHDYYYGLGFNEAAGNFQTDNFGKGGTANDGVRAQSQSGGFTDNASFASTPDGVSPRMRMGLFTRNTNVTTDDLDSDYDGHAVMHEYGHGVSDRLVGARNSTTCLLDIQSGAMSEGWSDYFAISFYNNPVYGSYVSRNSTIGSRRQSYEGYTFTYEDLGNGSHGYEGHDDGEIWAATLWDLRKSLGAGTTDRLVINGLKSTPCYPSMTDARDAILAADMATNAGANRTAIWTVFARHGMGYSAVGIDGSIITGTRYDAAYDIPPAQSTTNPKITSDPLLIGTRLGQAYLYRVEATNPGGGTLTYALNTGPAGMTVDSATGLVSWTAGFISARVKITVTDGKGGKVVHGYALSVVTPLTNNSAITIAGPQDSLGYAFINVPANSSVFQVLTRGGTGDVDIAVYDPDGVNAGLSVRDGNNETLSFPTPKAGLWVVEVAGYQTYANVTLRAALITPTLLSTNTSLTGLNGELSSETYYRITVPAGIGQLTISTSGGIGDVDLYLRRNAPPACQIGAVLGPCVRDFRSSNDGNAESIVVNNPAGGDWYLDLFGYEAYGNVKLDITAVFTPLTISLSGGAASSSSTVDTSSTVSIGYATANVLSGVAPFGTAVFSYTQSGYVVSEAGIPATPPTQSARIFVDYRSNVVTTTGPLNVSTGIAIVNRGTAIASITYTLRDLAGQTLAVGHGTLPIGAHRGKLVQELRDLASDFTLPANFSTATNYGTLEVTSSQPVSVLALRVTVNQRGDVLLTSTPVADLSKALTNTAIYFPQLVDGGGYITTVILVNTSGATESGTIAIFDNSGAPLTVTSNGTTAATFNYSIPANGAFVFQTNGSPAAARPGWVNVTPVSGNSPVGSGIFSYSPGGMLVTESGVPSAVPTTKARVYVDKSNGHDTGLAIANPGAAATVTIRAFQKDGATVAGNASATVNLAANAHDARFVGELISGLPSGFVGVAEFTSTTPIVALTLRSLTNARNDFLLTTFPIADANQAAPTPIVFPHIAMGGGYVTEFIVISATGSGAVEIRFYGDDGAQIGVQHNP